MAKQTLEYVAFWSGDQVAELFEAAAALMNTSDYQALLQTSALIGFLLMMVGAAIHYRLKDLRLGGRDSLLRLCAFDSQSPRDGLGPEGGDRAGRGPSSLGARLSRLRRKFRFGLGGGIL